MVSSISFGLHGKWLDAHVCNIYLERQLRADSFVLTYGL
jgi:hypothetical protein